MVEFSDYRESRCLKFRDNALGDIMWKENFDRSQPKEAMQLLNLFKKNMEEDQLLDLIDKYSEDMQLHGAEVVNVMRATA